jgi:PAS domain S-box-containing protein
MGEVMTALDPLAQGAGSEGRPHELLLPSAGDVRDLLERLPLIVYIDAPDPLSPSIYVSPQTTRILGYTPEDWASGEGFFPSILHPGDRDRVIAETAHMIATGERLESEYRLLRRDGSIAWVHDEGVLVRDEAGAPLCMQGYILDITEQKAREAALLASQATVESSFDAIITRTADGIVTGWNAAAERIFGYSAEEMLGRPVSLLVPPDEHAEFERVNALVHGGEGVGPFERVRLRKDGTRIHTEATVSPILGPGGEYIGASAISRDITERKRSEGLSAGQADLLEFIATGAALPAVLERLARFVEEHAAGVLASILLLDPDGLHLRHGAAPSLPAAYCEAIDGVAIGPSVGSCGTAAYRRERVWVADIATDPLWEG